MELKPGYKQTEVGVIPDDWDVRRLGECATFRTGPFGSALHKSDYVTDGVPLVNPMHIVNGEIKPSAEASVTEQVARSLPDFRLKTGEIVIGRRGDMGRCAVVATAQDGWVCGTGSMIIHCSEGVSADYIQRVLASPSTIAAIEATSVGSTMTNLNQHTLSGLRVALPQLEEQEAMASALNDLDGLQRSLETCITKKKALKKAAMQELLTGKRRLPGLEGEWEVKRLGEIADIDPENLGAGTLPGFHFNYISLEDVVHGNLRSYSEQVFESAPSRARRRLRQNDILVSTVRPNLLSHLLFGESGDSWVASTGFSVARCRPGMAHPGFVFAHLFADGMNRQIEALLTGSNYPAINSRDVRALEIPLPPYPEQCAIADVFSDIGSELSALEARRDKTRELKQGMLQELLNGRIRL